MKWILVGLGNPGSDYDMTRHNAGRMLAEYVAKKNSADEFRDTKKANAHITSASVKENEVTIVLPDTFMNKSGLAVMKFVKSAKAAERLIVCYDDLDLPLGALKVSFDRGSGGHKGVESVIRSVKTKKFIRVRIGVSPASAKGVAKKPSGEKAVLDFILKTFKPHERAILDTVFTRAADAIETIISDGRERAMNTSNRPTQKVPSVL